MGIKSALIKPLARRIAAKVRKDSLLAVRHQQIIFQHLVTKAKATKFGVDHNYTSIENHRDFIDQVPIRDYEVLKPYIDMVTAGQRDILWPGRPKYFAKTSGTTSGAKFIPITKQSMPNHFNSARNALFCQASRLNDFSFFNGKMIFLSGSPELDLLNGIPTGRLSGIVNHAVPSWLRKNQLPSYDTNCLEDWEIKIDRIIDETVSANMTLISGIPPWVKDYFERLIDRAKARSVGELFPNLQFIVHGGVNFEPYRRAFNDLIGRPFHSVETYPASEGFIAFQDNKEEDGLLLNTNSGIFYEFVPVDEIFHEKPTRLTISEVQIGVNYAIILSSNAGLWAYNIGDTVEFTSRNPYRIRVTGRIKHFISAFGEHVISKEIEDALTNMTTTLGLSIAAFTVAPMIEDTDGLSYHEYLLELESGPADEIKMATILDQSVQEANSYYRDLRQSAMLATPKITLLDTGTFSAYMRRQGKQGGQNKVPILSNNRIIADGLREIE